MNLKDESRIVALLRRGNFARKEHQYKGISWCLKRERSGVMLDYGVDRKLIKGGLIADEMGLGKTFQMVGTIICNFKGNTLIVVPLILIDQWVKIFEMTTGHIPLVYHGNVKKVSVEKLKLSPIVITTYGMISKLSSVLHKMVWYRIIFDEAHHLRNSNTTISKGSRSLKGSVRWLITGTPIQNKKKDFFTLCDAMGLPSEYYKRDRNLLGLVSNFILRRTKKDVGIEMPKLNTHTRLISWRNDSERELAHDLHLLAGLKRMYDASDSDSESSESSGCDVLAGNDLIGRFAGEGGGSSLPIVMFLKARQVCIFPRMLKGNYKDYKEGVRSSSKLDVVVSSIANRKNGRKKLIFSHFKGEIDELVKRLTLEGFKVAVVDGRISKGKRDGILHDREIDILILQIQTACEGLNLQHFSEIYFVSPHWNPSVEDQAIARCHRMGQLNDVDIFKFMMKDLEDDDYNFLPTIEFHISGVQDTKRRLLQKVLEPEVDVDN